jgi:hypothetical protein
MRCGEVTPTLATGDAREVVGFYSIKTEIEYATVGTSVVTEIGIG